MNKKFNLFLKHIEGKWLLLENFHFLPKNNVKTQEGKVIFLQNYTVIKSLKKDDKKYDIIDINCFNSDQNNNSLSEIKSIKHNLLVISITKNNKNLSYKEHLYKISENIIISLGILKNIQNNEYIGLKISSYIRIL